LSAGFSNCITSGEAGDNDQRAAGVVVELSRACFRGVLRCEPGRDQEPAMPFEPIPGGTMAAQTQLTLVILPFGLDPWLLLSPEFSS
jgi:hypothetical protein